MNCYITDQPCTLLTIYKLETYSERDGLWHQKGLFSSHKNARRYADNYDSTNDCYLRITDVPLLGYTNPTPNG